ncbi:hypothetical protein QA639_35140 [Bradyrhizobium pachyrhizi]|uniref:hypothetical protein n=1 Tax=Bradyrhizobium pachyrhizi TaxID=280333 RepID=UPI0024B1B939|nr:hypothetical protein [Bradyrhizobium pachyrhizi]WFU54765.1 hypothetical protein QA639_35140 [Bradyrhizobium pachyrhizi]
MGNASLLGIGIDRNPPALDIDKLSRRGSSTSRSIDQSAVRKYLNDNGRQRGEPFETASLSSWL